MSSLKLSNENEAHVCNVKLFLQMVHQSITILRQFLSNIALFALTSARIATLPGLCLLRPKNV